MVIAAASARFCEAWRNGTLNHQKYCSNGQALFTVMTTDEPTPHRDQMGYIRDQPRDAIVG
jgi:hypothetical protein